MLIKCKECHGQISDKAPICPHCGIPIKRRNTMTRSHMRLPNGFGSVTKVKKNLRRPYLARVTNAKDDLGRPQLKSLGYFRTYNEAYTALIEYNKDPYDLETEMTVKEAYEAFKRDVFDKESHSYGYTIAIKRAYKNSESLYDMPIRKIRPRHIKSVIDATDGIYNKNYLKSLWNRLLDYAVANELTDRNFARDFDLDPVTKGKINKYKQPHLTFSDAEMSTLWNKSAEGVARMILVQCYTGWRPNELCKILLSDVDLDNWSMKGGEKTEAGRGRVIPIHSAVRLLVSEQYEISKSAGSKYLFDMNYKRYYYHFGKFMKENGFNENHRPHDPRKQFATMAAKAGVDPMAVKRILGHSVSDVTEAVYTERDLEWLRTDIEKIKVLVDN